MNSGGWGGPRKGAGRRVGWVPGVHGERRVRRLVMLSDAEYQQARDLGEGNASAGIRRALAAVASPDPAAPPSPSP